MVLLLVMPSCQVELVERGSAPTVIYTIDRLGSYSAQGYCINKPVQLYSRYCCALFVRLEVQQALSGWEEFVGQRWLLAIAMLMS